MCAKTFKSPAPTYKKKEKTETTLKKGTLQKIITIKEVPTLERAVESENLRLIWTTLMGYI